MTILKTIEKENATGAVKAVYDMMEERVKFIPNVVKLHSASPEFFQHFMPLIGYYTDHPALDPVLVSYVRLLISNEENASYCVNLQIAVLTNYKVNIEEIKDACEKIENLKLDDKRKYLILFVLDMMYNNLTDSEKRIVQLKELGWTEKVIYEACMLGAIQKGVTKVITGFEVQNDF